MESLFNPGAPTKDAKPAPAPVAIAVGTMTKCEPNDGASLSSPIAISQMAIEFSE